MPKKHIYNMAGAELRNLDASKSETVNSLIVGQVVAHLTDENADGPQRLGHSAPFFFRREEGVSNYRGRDEAGIVVRS